ncbi:MAG: hypothetical protein MUF64_24415 [Polyangiaceae bacterium]|nr:hypothetical protein [Polyangiaceae bacterium]
MSKAPSPLLGFNNNIRHKGHVFHVQTEDSGVRHPHVITHLFMDGGRILKTTKTSYAEHLGQEGMGETVRRLMKEQHKAMFVALRNGDFDELIQRHFSASQEGEGGPVSRAPTTPERPPSQAQPALAVRAPSNPPAPNPPAPSPPAPNPPAPSPPAPRTPTAPPLPAAASPKPFPAARPAASASDAPPSVAPRAAPPERLPYTSDLPPPPPTVLGATRPEGGYRELRPEESSSSTYSEVNPSNDARSSSRLPVARPRPSSGRHPVARPQTGQHKPQEGRSLFGDDLNEKSLDEVILSYLAEDLDTPSGTKR